MFFFDEILFTVYVGLDYTSPGYFVLTSFSLQTCFSLGKVFIGNKREIAENRIPELNTYMKVITFYFMCCPQSFVLSKLVVGMLQKPTTLWAE